MNKFICNLNVYMEHYNLKHSFVALRAGIEKNKFSRLLNNKQDILYEDMELISKALGKEISYFLQENLKLTKANYKEANSIAFYMGSPDEGKKELANQVFDFLEHTDAILGVRKKIEKDTSEVTFYGS